MEGADILFLEIDLQTPLFEHADGLQGIHSVAGEAGDGFAKEEADFPFQGARQHLPESITPLTILLIRDRMPASIKERGIGFEHPPRTDQLK